MSTEEAQRRRGAESSAKLLRLLLEFSEQAPLRTAAELAARTQYPQSTVYRHIRVLKDFGLVDEASRGVYRLTERVFALASAARNGQGSLVEVARPYLERLRDEAGETVFLVRRSGLRAFCLDRVESRQAVRLSTAPGADMSLSAGSAGKVLLAALTERELARFRELVETSDPADAPPRRIPGDDELRAIRRQGFAESDGEIDPGVWGVSAPVIVHDRAVAALGVAGPRYRIDAPRQTAIRDAVITIANDLSMAVDAASGQHPDA